MVFYCRFRDIGSPQWDDFEIRIICVSFRRDGAQRNPGTASPPGTVARGGAARSRIARPRRAVGPSGLRLFAVLACPGCLRYISSMTKTQAKIIELFKTLDQAEQREVAQQLYERAAVGSFYDRMTVQQRAELDEGIAQAERGEVRSAEEVFDRLAKRFGFLAE
jgi:predicted transcriptional regulator